MFGWVRAAGTQTKRSMVGLGRRVGRVPLFTSVALALVVGVGIAAIAQWVLSQVIATNKNAAAPIDITKLALTIVGGVGGAVALVVAYRRQRDLEQNRFTERFGAAAAQLGSADVAIRMAGVYAMAGVADESSGLNRQQCIDVLCGYLRLPYDATHGGSGRAKLVTKTVVQRTSSGAADVEQEEHTEYRQNDREVRKTIVRVIADHLRPDAEYDWTTNDFDFRTAQLESANFYGAQFRGTARFDQARFSGTTEFAGATFSGAAWFEETTFSGDVSFLGATIGWSVFEGATFSGTANFRESKFTSTASFPGATFSGDTWFRQARFDIAADFTQATFTGMALFVLARFTGEASFTKATFTGEALFGGAKFSGIVRFTETVFGPANFEVARFSGPADFSATTFSGDADFSKAKFDGSGIFPKATFSSSADFGFASFAITAEFSQASFCGEARFLSARFSGRAEFQGARFSGEADFSMAAFSGEADFSATTFSGSVEFSRASFSSSTNFTGVAFRDRATFGRTEFGTDPVSFRNPRQWGPPPPTFDWDETLLSHQPGNVEPQDWPPVVQTTT
ncbi:pentapeptide repeat-containing protein [Nocardia amamiensis]|uniref:Pentapeptide repeat-containing protein n=1 Tax=Nocardia amamiensis TaxID=404578 RepID=A0ABS0CZW8_9NOCA|nr:pentapeptide repeat-containing protein [Nocardia amamiensis]MBF6302137.1 pentapeptide repeat-containing protein [Nocardia amamiensis]